MDGTLPGTRRKPNGTEYSNSESRYDALEESAGPAPSGIRERSRSSDRTFAKVAILDVGGSGVVIISEMVCTPDVFGEVVEMVTADLLVSAEEEYLMARVGEIPGYEVLTVNRV